MTAPVTEIAVNGTPLDLGAIEYQITLTHGRNDIQQQPTPSDAQLFLYGLTDLPCEISDVISIEAYNEPRFTGQITDLTLTHYVTPNGDSTGRLEITAVGNLAKLGLLNVGESGYAETTLQTRVDDILDETGLVYQANTDPNMVQLAVDPVEGGSPALGLLNTLCAETGATMTDLPDGAILFESYTRRGYGYNPATWAGITDTWDDVTGAWFDIYERTETAPAPVVLPASTVIFEPIWRNTVTTVLNQVTVTYGDADPRDTHTESDSASIATHGLRAFNLDTRLADLTDAVDRAGAIIRSQSEPRYAMQNVGILVHRTSDPLRGQILGLLQGSRVQIDDLPLPAPLSQYTGVVEGWSETYTPEEHILTVSLSDPRYSYALARWSEVDDTLEWGDVNASIQWYNVVQASDLAA